MTFVKDLNSIETQIDTCSFPGFLVDVERLTSDLTKSDSDSDLDSTSCSLLTLHASRSTSLTYNKEISTVPYNRYSDTDSMQGTEPVRRLSQAKVRPSVDDGGSCVDNNGYFLQQSTIPQ